VSAIFLIIFIQLQFYWTVLHPRHKLQYFRKANWDTAWIATATAIVHDEFVRAYADLPIVDDVPIIHKMNVRAI